MDGFKNSTRVQYMKGGACEGYAKGGKVRGAAKINKVMSEFKAGTLHSGSKKGPEVTSKKQAVAIALSEARKAGAKMPVKRNKGTPMGKGPEGGLADGLAAALARAKFGAAVTKAEMKSASDQAARQLASAARRKLGSAATEAELRAVADEEARAVKARSQRSASAPARAPASTPKLGVPVDSRKAMIGGPEAADVYMARLPRGAVRAAQPAIPSYTPGTRSGLKKGGLAAMPKGKGCKK